ncbi:MAG: PAS domain-containing protein [Okeania sp. SIO3I5]|uniref:ATP-binding protein n=1 Tax=Okeania sp. SIO3I5 TaxID=2607805 RepID=UPI0013BBDAE7|nr:ATP-binding protein [Okeania sp. SIO3I5]NEQ38657.1 PAS domain-containing protein [Okeania sp. SIO3I5]
MTPEQFSELARVLPEPSIFLNSTGEILAINKPASSLFELPSKELKGKKLSEFLTDNKKNVMKYLQACSKSRKMVIGSLTIRTSAGDIVVCRSEGAVIQPKQLKSPAQLILRLEKKSKANNNFILLNQKIQELNTQVKLKLTLQELQETQIQLVQKEKLSALGKVAAGIAHEINNPVNFIHGNLKPAQEYAQHLLELIQLYQQYYPDPPQEIKEEIEEIDLEFIIEDITKLLQSISIGTERIRELVKSMRTFSRLDETEIKYIDIHEALDSSLIILNHRLNTTPNSPNIEVIKNYGQLPKIQCYCGQINQVFMNILSNAIDALNEYQEKNIREIQTNSPQIKIQTEVFNLDWISIRIIDNGPGIKEEIKPKLFDPFFTTKEVGKGTGLGLSISHDIITEKHGGKIFCDSTLGYGTEFVIQIPMKLAIRYSRSKK